MQELAGEEVMELDKGKVVSIEDRIPKLKLQRRKKANRRLIFLLLLFFALIACIIYFQSPLSKVKSLVVTGNSAMSSEEILAQTGITTSTNIWKVNKSGVKDELEKLPEIREAKVKVKFPNTILISVIEYDRIAYITKGKNFVPVLENGDTLDKEKMTDIPVNAPILIEFKEGKVLNEMISALEFLPSELLNSISEIYYTPIETDTYRIRLFMNDGFEVHATLRTFADKFAHYPSIVSQLDPGIKGVIDLEVGSYFKAYEAGGAENVEIQEAEG
ncbi:cell division protein FtsQ/DivIB [Mesobacillus harenae]|uniref:cell division protein FtsQ/DivIB n=1 Tax=Mesobacillus harenae TaxID=2213203 RepID=UPI0030CC0D39